MTQPSALQDRWKALAPREQNLVLAAGTVVALALLWWLAVAPALGTLRAAPARHAALDAQLQRMQSLQAEAQQLQATPATSPGDAVGALRTALTQRLGNTAQLNVAGDRATVGRVSFRAVTQRRVSGRVRQAAPAPRCHPSGAWPRACCPG